MKIIGKLDYDKQQCIIPGKFSLSLNEQIQTIKGENGLLGIPTSGEWPIFEVLLNPRRLNLNADYVYLRREKEENKFGGLLPARPLRAQSAPPSPLNHKNRHPPPSYLAFCRYQDTSDDSSYQYYYYPGVVVEEELDQNGTLAFYYGLSSVYDDTVCSVYVVAVLNRRMPPQPIDYSRRFNKL